MRPCFPHPRDKLFAAAKQSPLRITLFLSQVARKVKQFLDLAWPFA